MKQICRFRFWSGILGFALILNACTEFKPNTDSLSAQTAVSQSGANCASCHAYPLHDMHHQYHLYVVEELKRINGAISCMDCHRTAIAGRAVKLPDTIYFDTNQNPYSSIDFPNDPKVRAYRLGHIDTVIQNRPLPIAAHPGRFALMQEWMTANAHLNGRIDVVFDPRVSDTSNYKGKMAEYHVAEQTCSAVACHERIGPYRWPAPSKGFKPLTGDTAQ